MTATLRTVGSNRRVGAMVLAALLVCAAVAVGLVGPNAGARAQVPTCPQGSTFNAATGQCEAPATVAPCPSGTTLAGNTCTATVECPGLPFGFPGFFSQARLIVEQDPTGAASATCSTGGAGDAVIIACPAGTISSFERGTPGLIPGGANGTITCTAPVPVACPAGFSPSGTVCVAPPTQVPDLPPAINVSKSAVPSTRSVPEGTFVYLFRVTNLGSQPVTIVELTDTVRGNLNGVGTCSVGVVVAPGTSYDCSIIVKLFSNTPTSETGVFTARVVDAQGRSVAGSDAETIALVVDADSADGTAQGSSCVSQFRSGITNRLAAGGRLSPSTVRTLLRQYKSCIRAGGS